MFTAAEAAAVQHTAAAAAADGVAEEVQEELEVPYSSALHLWLLQHR